MGFDIAIYNASCFDGNRVINSAKAAYLYGDKVRVYDIPRIEKYIPENLSDSLKIIDKMIIALQQRHPLLFIEGTKYSKIDPNLFSGEVFLDPGIDNPKYNEFLELISSDLTIKDTREKAYEFGFTNEDIKMINQYLDVCIECEGITNRYYNIFFLKEYKRIWWSVYGIRQLTRSGYTSEEYDKMLKHLNIEIVQPVLDSKTALLDYESFENSFLKDHSFKIMNDTIRDSKIESLFLSMWATSYLSEYAISSLPGFEEAAVDEIIDIRKELNKYIIPYRAAILKMAGNIKEVPDTESLQRECMVLYLRDIEPQVASINAAIADNNVFKNIAKNFVTSEKTWASMGALATAFITTGDIANALSVGTAAAFGGWSIAKSIISSLEEKKKIKDNEIFFLYQAGKKLKR